MNTQYKKAIVVHSGLQHAEHVAKSYYDASRLMKFCTSNFWHRRKSIETILSMSPKLHKMYQNRSTNRLPKQVIDNFGASEIIARILPLIKRNYEYQRRITHWHDRRLSKHYAKKVTIPYTTLYSFPNVAKDLFEARQGGEFVNILDLPIGHYSVAARLAYEERYMAPEFHSTFSYSDPPNLFKERFEREIELADKMFCGTKFVRDTFIEAKISARNLVVSRFGSSLEPLSEAEKDLRLRRADRAQSDCFNVVYVGQFSQRKGLSYLLQTIRLLKRNYPQLRFTMIGGFIGSREWLTNNTDIIDEIIVGASRTVVRQKLMDAHSFFFPSLFEGGALALHEAASMGLPIVTTHNAGADFLETSNSGYLLGIRDVDAYAASLSTLIEDRNCLTQKTISALDWSGKANWEQFKADLLAI